jgi:hypothetical protein
MPVSQPAFSQIVSGLHAQAFGRCVEQFPMRRSSRRFSAYDHSLALCFGQLTYRESLRDIVACLNARPSRQYHLGFRGHVTRTNFAYANEWRDWRMFAAVAEGLIRRASQLYRDDKSDPDFPRVVLALDASLNAIYCQIWTAICTCLLVAIAKKELKLEKSLYEILQILSVSAFEQRPVSELLANDDSSSKNDESQNAPYLLGF